MFTSFYSLSDIEKETPKEGDVYRELTVDGRNFKILYGYYEEFERNSRYNDAIPIYPDFIKNPVYTDEGIPVVTAMQDICKYYEGLQNEDGDSCQECCYFKKREDLFGICNCFNNRKINK